MNILENDDLIKVRKNPNAFQFVKNQTEEICLAAVKQDGWALKYVINITSKILELIYKNNLKIPKIKIDTKILKTCSFPCQLWFSLKGF